MTATPSTEPNRITDYAHDTSHVAEGIALLYRQFASKPLFTALVSSYLKQVQEIEDALWNALTKTTLDTATAAQLDQIGAVLVWPRGSLSDTDYRAILRALIAARRSRGFPEDIITVARLLFGLQRFRDGSASITIEPEAPYAFAPSAALTVLDIAKSPGIQLQLFDPPEAEASLFTFSDDPMRVQTDAARGFSDTSQITGGALTGVSQ